MSPTTAPMPKSETSSPAGGGHVLEVAGAVVAVEGLGRRRVVRRRRRVPGRLIDEEEVGVAVGVVVEHGDARAHRLGQQLLARRRRCSWTKSMPASSVISTNRTSGSVGRLDDLRRLAGRRRPGRSRSPASSPQPVIARATAASAARRTAPVIGECAESRPLGSGRAIIRSPPSGWRFGVIGHRGRAGLGGQPRGPGAVQVVDHDRLGVLVGRRVVLRGRSGWRGPRPSRRA